MTRSLPIRKWAESGLGRAQDFGDRENLARHLLFPSFLWNDSLISGWAPVDFSASPKTLPVFLPWALHWYCGTFHLKLLCARLRSAGNGNSHANSMSVSQLAKAVRNTIVSLDRGLTMDRDKYKWRIVWPRVGLARAEGDSEDGAGKEKEARRVGSKEGKKEQRNTEREDKQSKERWRQGGLEGRRDEEGEMEGRRDVGNVR